MVLSKANRNALDMLLSEIQSFQDRWVEELDEVETMIDEAQEAGEGTMDLPEERRVLMRWIDAADTALDALREI